MSFGGGSGGSSGGGSGGRSGGGSNSNTGSNHTSGNSGARTSGNSGNSGSDATTIGGGNVPPTTLNNAVDVVDEALLLNALTGTGPNYDGTGVNREARRQPTSASPNSQTMFGKRDRQETASQQQAKDAAAAARQKHGDGPIQGR